MIKQNLVGKRPLKRPKMRWEDTVKKDMEALGEPNWKILVFNR